MERTSKIHGLSSEELHSKKRPIKISFIFEVYYFINPIECKVDVKEGNFRILQVLS
jgi:hypothetical protein